MIKKTVYCFLLLFLIYTAVWKWGNIKDAEPQEVWQENQIKAQNYLYDKNINPENIIVGSSMACFISTDSLHHFYNLSLRGETVYTGMKIIIEKNKFPKRLFIEANLINKLTSVSPVFEDIIYNPVLKKAREKITVIRDGKQPISKIGSIIDSALIQNDSLHYSLYDRTTLIDNNMTDSAGVLSKVGFYFLRDFAIEEQNETHQLLKSYLDIFEQNDVEIIFFYLPFNKYMWNLPYLVQTRNWLKTNFPEGRSIQYMDLFDVNAYFTYDGLHMTHREAQIYSSYFKKQVENMTEVNVEKESK